MEPASFSCWASLWCIFPIPMKASTIQTWRSEKSRRTPNTCIYLTLKKASGIKYFYLLPKAWNLHGCFFYLPVNVSICLSNTKPHCVTKLRASTQRCACCVLELLWSNYSNEWPSKLTGTVGTINHPCAIFFKPPIYMVSYREWVSLLCLPTFNQYFSGKRRRFHAQDHFYSDSSANTPVNRTPTIHWWCSNPCHPGVPYRFLALPRTEIVCLAGTLWDVWTSVRDVSRAGGKNGGRGWGFHGFL